MKLNDIDLNNTSKQFLLYTKIASGNDAGMQQIQVLPVQAATGNQQIIMQPNTAAAQAQTAQVIQTADGQTLIYQPVQVNAHYTIHSGISSITVILITTKIITPYYF